MAAFTTNLARPQRVTLGLFERLDALFTSIAKARACVQDVDALTNLTDAQLAERGLDRTDIVRHAARAYL